MKRNELTMGFSLDTSIPAITVFLQGLISFFSPCVLPLLPLYIGYLSGGTAAADEDGKMHYDRSKVMTNTVFFVIGISAAFFLLGLGMTAIGRFFSEKQLLLARIGGAIVILFGLYQLGVFGSIMPLSRERRLPIPVEKMAMSPLTAFLMGFVFSFAWTPCVGPTLSSVLIMAAAAGTQAKGFMLIGVYTLGFIIPFLAVGMFATGLLDLFRRHQNVVRWTVKVGGALMILMGVMMITGWMNSVSGYLSSVSLPEPTPGETYVIENETPAPTPEPTPTPEPEDADAHELPPAPDFALLDQYGYLRSLSDYRGKTVFLNIWATWCPYCVQEMPDIQSLYEEYGDDGEVVFLGVAFPGIGGEYDTDGVISFLEENGYTYPCLMDTEGALLQELGVTAYPTTFMITREGTIFGYVPGAMSRELMEDVIRQTLEGQP